MPIAMGPLERAAFAANVAPAPVLDYVGALGPCAMFTGLRVGVLTALAPTLSTPTCTAAKNSSGSARLMLSTPGAPVTPRRVTRRTYG